jgi:hypothetical protein
MGEVLNGEILPALSQWQGAFGIGAVVCLGAGVRLLRALRSAGRR